MTMLSHLLATLALALPATPAAVPQVPGGADRWQAALDPGAGGRTGTQAPRALGDGVLVDLADALPTDTWDQVRIEQRLIIRITPRAPGRDELASLPQPVTVRLRERKMAKCLPVAGIAGVKPMSDSRLMLFLRDRRIVGADLAKTCSARDFYLGFYVSQTPDGQLCVGRDQIHSRAGATCLIDRVRELVPDN